MRFQESYKLNEAIEPLREALLGQMIAGDGPFTHRCENWLEKRLGCQKILMTTSCTHALELALKVMALNPGDEVILPSFTYPSTANAVLLAGGTVVYSEVEPLHLTLDPARLAEKITSRTRAILCVHYGGVCCDMDPIQEIATTHCLDIIEDAAQGFLATYKGRYAGTMGRFGAFSFHGSKDVVAGEGGALLINDAADLDVCQQYRLKGTDRKAFDEGKVPFYTWQGPGSSFSPSELLMALLWSQLNLSDEVLVIRKRLFQSYSLFFQAHPSPDVVGFANSPEYGEVNGHLFYVVFRTTEAAIAFKAAMNTAGIPVHSHFVPLHESAYGNQFIRPINHFNYESGLGTRLLRLPLHGNLSDASQQTILTAVLRHLEGI